MASFNVIKVNDPRLRLADPKTFAADVGAKTVNYLKQNANGQPSTSSNSYEINPGNNNICTDSRWYEKYQFNVVIANNTSPINFDDGTFGLRKNAVDFCTNNLQLQLNQSTISQSYPYLMAAMDLYCSDPNFLKTDPSGLAMPDQAQSVSELLGSSLNPLNPYSSGNPDGFMPRGAVNSSFVVASNATGDVDFTFEIVVPVRCSPLKWGPVSGPAMINIQQFTLTRNFLGTSLARMFLSSRTDFGFSDITVTLPSTPVLYTELLGPQPDQIIPPVQALNYDTYNPQVPNVGSITAGSTTNYSCNTITLNKIPKLLFIWAQENHASKTLTSPDVYAKLSDVNIQFLNQTSILSNAAPAQLYNVCKRNGLSISYLQFISKIGSVICLRGSDLQLDMGLAPGVSDVKTNLVVTLNITNISGRTINYDLCILPIIEGVVSLPNDNGVTTVQSVVNSQQVLDAPYAGVQFLPVYGSGIFDTLKGFASKAHDFIKENKLVSQGLNYLQNANIPVASNIAQFAAPIAKNLGYGQGGHGGAMIGGAMMDQGQWQQFAQNARNL